MKPEPTAATTHSEQDKELTELISSVQTDLRCYIISLIGNANSCDDILQETNLFLWQKRDRFTLGTDFKAWAFRAAYFNAMSSRRDLARRGEVHFSEYMIEKIAPAAMQKFSSKPTKLTALGKCLKKLTLAQNQLLNIKYVDKLSLTDYAAQIGKPVNVLHKQISRLRFALRSCIEQEMKRR